jgi:protein gp37
MGDLFHEQVPDEFIDEVFSTMWLADVEQKGHTFLLLTKRPERMRDYIAYRKSRLLREYGPEHEKAVPHVVPNVWLGVTAENQHWADERISLLLATPAAHRWVSLEPLLSAVDISRYLPRLATDTIWPDAAKLYHRGLDACVVGGESGPGHRPMELSWARSIVTQCQSANVPVYFKQAAASRPGQPAHDLFLDFVKELPWAPQRPPDGQEPPEQEDASCG